MSVTEVVGRYFHGVNHEDWDDFRGIWHDDAVVDVVGGIHVQGWDEILPYYVDALSNFPVHHDDPYGVHVAGDTVTVEIAFTGETVDGVPTTFEAVDIFTLEKGLVRRLTTWYDLDRVLGFLRTPGAPERRLRTLVRHAAAASPFYRRVLEGIALAPDVVAGDLALVPVTLTDGVPAGELVAASPNEIRQIVAGVSGAVPLARSDLEERGRIWGDVLVLGGVGREDTVLALDPSPGLTEGVARVRARFAYETDAAAVGATVAIGPAERLSTSQLGSARALIVLGYAETGVVASSCTAGTMHAHTRSHVVEIVDGELVVTPLGARALPLLRWSTGTKATWLAEPCPCGTALPGLLLS
jgi:hypothetical protein